MIRTEESSRRRIATCRRVLKDKKQTKVVVALTGSRPPTLDSSQITDSRPRDSRIMSRDPYIDVKRYSTHPDLLPR